MKILVEFDQNGFIKSIATRAEGASVALRARPGHRVAELEASSVRDERDHEHLLEIKRNHRVEVENGGAKLLPR